IGTSRRTVPGHRGPGPVLLDVHPPPVLRGVNPPATVAAVPDLDRMSRRGAGHDLGPDAPHQCRLLDVLPGEQGADSRVDEPRDAGVEEVPKLHRGGEAHRGDERRPAPGPAEAPDDPGLALL